MVFATAVKPNTTKLLTIQCKNRMIAPMTEVNNATNSKSFSTLQFREKPRQEKQMSRVLLEFKVFLLNNRRSPLRCNKKKGGGLPKYFLRISANITVSSISYLVNTHTGEHFSTKT